MISMFSSHTNAVTSVKVVNEAVFSAVVGKKVWKFMGISLFGKEYNESIGEVEFLDEKESKPSMGFAKKEKK